MKIDPSTTVLAVIGLGYVGLPVACEFARVGFQVIGVDLRADRIAKIQAGINPIEGNEPGLSELLAEVIGSGRLRVTTDYASLQHADVITLNVETPVDDDHKPRYMALQSACRSLGAVLKSGALVIVESTVAPGTTLNFVRPILEQASGLPCLTDDLTSQTGFYLGACPERVMPGRLLANLRNLSRVCGGSTPAVASRMTELYRHIIREADLDPTDCLTAELVKTTENAYRDVNIAFANEVALICESVGGDVWKVRELVNKSPGRNMLLPGAGVGGHCIPKDPWLLASGVSNSTQIRLIPAARSINDSMPLHVVDLLCEALETYKVPIFKARVAVLGYSYLENSDDTRNSPSMPLCEQLQRLGAQVIIHDPWVEEYKGSLHEAILNCDALIVMVAHSEYCNLDFMSLKSLLRTPILIDGRHVLDLSLANASGFVTRGIGR